MEKANLEIGYLFSSSLNFLKNKWDKLLGAFIVYFGIVILSTIASEVLFKKIAIMKFLINFGITGPFIVGFLYLLLRSYRMKNVNIPMLFDGFNKYWESVAINFFVIISVMIGTILLIIPGIFMAVRLIPIYFLVLDEKSTIFEKITHSFELTKGKFWQLVMVLIFIAIFNLLGAICFLVGLLFTIPMTCIIQTVIYEELKKEYEEQAKKQSLLQ